MDRLLAHTLIDLDEGNENCDAHHIVALDEQRADHEDGGEPHARGHLERLEHVQLEEARRAVVLVRVRARARARVRVRVSLTLTLTLTLTL